MSIVEVQFLIIEAPALLVLEDLYDLSPRRRYAPRTPRRRRCLTRAVGQTSFSTHRRCFNF